MNDDGRSLVLKKVLMHFLRKFPTDFENADQADDYIRKTLNLWRMFVSIIRLFSNINGLLGKMQQNNGTSCHFRKNRGQLR